MIFMKQFIKSLIRRIIPVPIVNIPPYPEIPDLKPDILNTQIAQKQLFFHYQALKSQKLSLPRFQDTGFRAYSQSDEDGLLLYIFALIGFTNKVCVDMAFGLPYGANTTNLLCNWGFTGLLVEGEHSEKTKKFFLSHKDTWLYPPKLVDAWITAENVNEICTSNSISGEIDLFSLDLDGVDYWIWKALTVIQPRVVVVEYQDIWGYEKSVTVPYSPDFDRHNIHLDFCSASLPAFVKLAKTKGYRLVGVHRYGFNAFFVKNGLADDLLPEVSVKECFAHPKNTFGMKQRLPLVEKLDWVEV